MGTSAQPAPKTCEATAEPPAVPDDVGADDELELELLVGADDDDELDEVGADDELVAAGAAGAAGAEPEPDEPPQAARPRGTAAASAMRALLRRVNMSELL
ncbi:MAG: hypothetical protein ACR2JN_07815 [Lapillicoccus sp.]